MNDVEKKVMELVSYYFGDIPSTVSISTDLPFLPEDAWDFFEKYFDTLNIDSANFNFRRYYPNSGVRFLPNSILPKYLRTDHHDPSPLTVEMLIESAKAGRWLYA
ncbi:hypothetical protein PMPD1_2947 [Paramixta manurensis]|uniref:DUF1493 family protein n=1 Tax=Paramixta manurensis TaxID=2740817 RepID=A0A6M8ULV8_9GAMM|nr:hypothetical protein PMPD1_2947 [Erwiniaceae bacterium PD-1]